MQDLINKIMDNAGISQEQSTKALEAVKDYVKEKFPMMADAVDKLFEGNGGPAKMNADVDDYV